MAKPSKTKSRSFRRISKKTPGASVVVHYERRLPGQAKCAGCGKNLHGIPRGETAKMKNLPKTHKRPERPYGGVLCSSCTRETIKANME